MLKKASARDSCKLTYGPEKLHTLRLAWGAPAANKQMKAGAQDCWGLAYPALTL